MAKYSDVIAGLRLFETKGGPGAHMGGADHDVIYGASADTEFSAEELAQLESWGWCKSDEYDCWILFV